MRIPRIGLDKPALVVLGAGATRGEIFVENASGPLPPMDSDFFTQAQRLDKSKGGWVQELVRNVTQIFGNNFSLTMEQYLTHLEQMRNVYDNYRMQGRPAEGNPYRNMRDNFLRVLWAVLDESLGWEPKDEMIAHHKALVGALQETDTILSFNYDWLIDRSLARFGAEHSPCIWNPTRGYGVKLDDPHGTGFMHWACRKGHVRQRKDSVYRPGKTLLLLKLHGSMNWFPAGDDEQPRLRLRSYQPRRGGSSQFEIVPPEWQKATDVGIYPHVWQRARTKARYATNMVFIGYSMPETDLPVRALFMVDADKGEKLRWLILVNPDSSARKRIRAVLHRRMNEKTRVLTFDSFEEYAKFLRVNELDLVPGDAPVAPARSSTD